MYGGLESLATERINAIAGEILEEQAMDAGNNAFDARIPQVPAEDGDVTVRIKGSVLAADIIQTDQEAVVHRGDEVRTTTTAIPKLKHGYALPESQIILLRNLERGTATARQRVSFDDWTARKLRALLGGIRDRRKLLYSAMLRDTLTYNRLGIQISNATWGMPANLKVTLTGGDRFDQPATAKPISRIQAYLNAAKTNHGRVFDRMEMRSSVFDHIVRTDEFKNLAPSYNAFALPGNAENIPILDRGRMTQLLSAMFGGASLELVDEKTQIEVGSGALENQFILPEADIVFTTRSDDNDPEAMDFANAVVIETLPRMVPLIIGGDFAEESDGPVSYATAADGQGNPPGEVLWAVQRGFPRKHKEDASGVMTVL